MIYKFLSTSSLIASMAIILLSCDSTTNIEDSSSDSTGSSPKLDVDTVSNIQSIQASDTASGKTETNGTITKASPKLVSLTATFHTTDNDKDWDTQIGCTVRLNGHIIGEIFCCSAARDDDHYNDNSDSPPIYLKISENPTKDELNGGVYEITAREVHGGNDEWHFDARLNATFEDGTQRNWTFLKQSLHSKNGSREGIKFDLYKNHD